MINKANFSVLWNNINNIKGFSSHNTSNGEALIYGILIKYFGEDDVFYDCPILDLETNNFYRVDFFIKSINLFIEYGYHGTERDDTVCKLMSSQNEYSFIQLETTNHLEEMCAVNRNGTSVSYKLTPFEYLFGVQEKLRVELLNLFMNKGLSIKRFMMLDDDELSDKFAELVNQIKDRC